MSANPDPRPARNGANAGKPQTLKRRPVPPQHATGYDGSTPLESELQERCILAVIEGTDTFNTIAKALRVDRKTIYNWRQKDRRFQARLRFLVNRLRSEKADALITSKKYRIDTLQLDWDRLIEQMVGRAERFADADSLNEYLGKPKVTTCDEGHPVESTTWAPHPAAHTGLYEVGIEVAKDGTRMIRWTCDYKTLERREAIRNEIAKILLEPGFVNPAWAGLGDEEERVDDYGTRANLTPEQLAEQANEWFETLARELEAKEAEG